MQTMLDFYEAAPARGLADRTLMEIRKLPKRLNLDEDEDLVEYPADLKTFEERIAPAGAAVFAKAKQPTRARKEANSRLRTALKAFLAAEADDAAPDHRPDWDALHAWVQDNEGFVDRGARFPNGRARTVACLRARFAAIAPWELDTDTVARALAAAPAEKRKSIRRAVRFLGRLQEEAATLPEAIRRLLPAAPLALPAPTRDAHWPNLPGPLRTEAEAMFDAILAQPELLVEDALARLDAGEDPEAVAAEVNASRTRETRNPAKWRKNYRGVISWLYRAALRAGVERADTLDGLFSRPVVEAAIDGHLADAAAGALRPSKETQSLKSRIDGVKRLAKYGRNDPGLVAAIDLLRHKHKGHVRNRHVKSLAKGSERLVTELHRGGAALMRRIVNAPQLIHQAALEDLASWQDQNPDQRLATLKLCAAAAMWALQMSRPRRRINLICERLRAARDPVTRRRTHPRTLWEEGADIACRTPAIEVKNGVDLEFPVDGADAEIVRWWIDEIRPKLIAERGLDKSNIYLFPGVAQPADLPEGVVLPAGTVSVAWFGEVWRRGAEVIGLDITSHQARHTLVTAWLQVNPGDFAGAAALLGDREEIVREKYGRDDGAQVAGDVRAQTRKHFNSPKKRRA